MHNEGHSIREKLIMYEVGGICETTIKLCLMPYQDNYELYVSLAFELKHFRSHDLALYQVNESVMLHDSSSPN